MARRSFLIDAETGIKLIGSRFSPDSRRLREFLARNRMPYQWIDLEEDDDAEALLDELAVEPDQTPVVIAGGGEILRNPTNEELGGRSASGQGATPALCDLVVVGAGPAGLAAALYAASEGSTFREWMRSPPADRPGRRRGSRTTSVFQPGYRAASWPSVPVSRRSSSAPAWLCRPGPSADQRTGPTRDRAFERRGGDRPHRGDRHRGAIPPPRCAAARRVRDGRRLLRRHRRRRSSAPAIGSDRRRRKLSRPGSDVPVPARLSMPAPDSWR